MFPSVIPKRGQQQTFQKSTVEGAFTASFVSNTVHTIQVHISMTENLPFCFCGTFFLENN